MNSGNNSKSNDMLMFIGMGLVFVVLLGIVYYFYFMNSYSVNLVFSELNSNDLLSEDEDKEDLKDEVLTKLQLSGVDISAIESVTPQYGLLGTTNFTVTLNFGKTKVEEINEYINIINNATEAGSLVFKFFVAEQNEAYLANTLNLIDVKVSSKDDDFEEDPYDYLIVPLYTKQSTTDNVLFLESTDVLDTINHNSKKYGKTVVNGEELWFGFPKGTPLKHVYDIYYNKNNKEYRDIKRSMTNNKSTFNKFLDTFIDGKDINSFGYRLTEGKTPSHSTTSKTTYPLESNKLKSYLKNHASVTWGICQWFKLDFQIITLIANKLIEKYIRLTNLVSHKLDTQPKPLKNNVRETEYKRWWSRLGVNDFMSVPVRLSTTKKNSFVQRIVTKGSNNLGRSTVSGTTISDVTYDDENLKGMSRFPFARNDAVLTLDDIITIVWTNFKNNFEELFDDDGKLKFSLLPYNVEGREYEYDYNMFTNFDLNFGDNPTIDVIIKNYQININDRIMCASGFNDDYQVGDHCYEAPASTDGFADYDYFQNKNESNEIDKELSKIEKELDKLRKEGTKMDPLLFKKKIDSELNFLNDFKKNIENKPNEITQTEMKKELINITKEMVNTMKNEIKSANEMSNEMPNKMPNEIPNEIPNEMANEMPNEMKNKMPNEMPNEIKSANEMSNEMPNEIPNEIPNEMANEMPNEMKNKMPNEMPIENVMAQNMKEEPKNMEQFFYEHTQGGDGKVVVQPMEKESFTDFFPEDQSIEKFTDGRLKESFYVAPYSRLNSTDLDGVNFNACETQTTLNVGTLE